MRMLRFLVICFCLISTQQISIAQTFKVTGRVVDKEHKNSLSSATISVFDADSTVVAFQISNTYGDFTFNIEKIKYPVSVRISNVGYYVKTIPFEKINPENIALGRVELMPLEVGIEEVQIRVAPVTLNGDTLEFNPQAFKLDSNAVLDDFLRKIPNVTIWGDGQITVNGKEVTTLIVNGQPFFGTDFKVALGNLPKDVIQKVQVYKKEGQLNTIDSLLEMNVKLKTGMENGAFGKLIAGVGTYNRHDVLANLNYFSKKLQLSLTATHNNVNKIANNNNELVAISAYKTQSVDNNYQSNFVLPNDNTAFTTGLTMRYDFLDKPNLNLRNNLSAEYFKKRLDVYEDRRTVSLITLTNQLINNEDNLMKRDGVNNEDLMQLSYDYDNRMHKLSIQTSRNSYSSEQASVIATTVNRPDFGLLSTYTGNLNADRLQVDYNLNLNYAYNGGTDKSLKFLPFELSYSINSRKIDGDDLTITQFLSYLSPSDNIKFNRGLTFVEQQDQQTASLKFPNILGALKTYVLPFDLTLRTKYNSKRNQRDQEAYNMEGGRNEAIAYLSNESDELLKRLDYGIELHRNFGKRLTGRFERNLSFSVIPMFTSINYQVVAQNTEQNMQRNKQYFNPEASIAYTRNVVGKFHHNTSLKYNTLLNYPTLQQIMPLIDSTQIYQVMVGNKNLEAEQVKRIHLAYNGSSSANVNTITYAFNAGYDFSNNKISNSLKILSDNRQEISFVNVDNFDRYYLDASLKKSYKIANSSFQISLDGGYEHQNSPLLINSNFVLNANTISNVGALVHFSWNNIFSIEFRESAYFYRTKQEFYKSLYSGNSYKHVLNMGYRISSSTLLSSDINYITNKTSSLPSSKFAIWNAQFSSKLFKAQNIEFKLTAQDLLRQNKNISNRIGVNRFVTQYQNSLQNYFLVSLAYYPRKFGL